MVADRGRGMYVDDVVSHCAEADCPMLCASIAHVRSDISADVRQSSGYDEALAPAILPSARRAYAKKPD